MGRTIINADMFCQILKHICNRKTRNHIYNSRFVPQCQSAISKIGSYSLDKMSVSIKPGSVWTDHIDVFYSDKAYPDGPLDKLLEHHDDFCGPKGPRIPIEVLIAAGVSVAVYGAKKFGLLTKLRKAPVIRKLIVPVVMVTGVVAVVDRGGGFFDAVGSVFKDGVCLFFGCGEAH